ncbi:hypothetical protein [Naasia sp. SYSU D00948]|nr:hypothetical protein [Naasia sp. SYSU D00948]
MDTSADSPAHVARLEFEQRRAMMRDLVFGLALDPIERQPQRPDLPRD